MSSDPSQLSAEIAENVLEIQETVRQAAVRVGRDPSAVQVIAASKTASAHSVVQAYLAGVRIFGENRLQEAQQKIPAVGLREGLAWHFIGRMQRRKLRDIVGNFSLIHSVETIEQAQRIHSLAEQSGIHQDILLEVNVAGEVSKGGFVTQEVRHVVKQLERFPHVAIKGLMTLPPFSDNPEDTRPYFSELRRLRDALEREGLGKNAVKELSMGMSNDYPVAIEEGATMVRIGTAIFGKRQ